MKKIIIVLIMMSVILGCYSDATVVSGNLRTEADQFRIRRRIVFYNAITDKYIMEIVGNCSILKDNSDDQLEITSKVGDNTYKKHFFGLSDNTCYFVEQLEYKEVSKYDFKIIYKPKSIIPIQIEKN